MRDWRRCTDCSGRACERDVATIWKFTICLRDCGLLRSRVLVGGNRFFLTEKLLASESGNDTFHVEKRCEKLCFVQVNVMGARGIAEGDFMRGYFKVAKRDGNTAANHGYTQGTSVQAGAYDGADQMMVVEAFAFAQVAAVVR